MKKLSFLGNLAVGLGFSLLVVSCQKQQDAVTTDTPTDAAVIKTISGSGYSGKISGSDAEEMYKTYKGSSSNGGTDYVTFKISDLKAYLAALEAKGKTDEVNVNLAIYDAKTAPKDELVGRTTIFFSPGLPKSRTRGSGGRIGQGMIVFDDNADYMNHGQIYP